jgi:hypothetical protein
LDVSPHDPTAPVWSVSVTFGAELPPGTTVRVLWKRFSGFSDWQAAATHGGGKQFQATIVSGHTGEQGAMFAVEIVSGPSAWRLPDVMQATPYIILPPN